MNRFRITNILIFSLLTMAARTQVSPPAFEKSAGEPVRYTGTLHADKHFYDGRIPHASGVHSYQVYRANRDNPPEGGMVGWTYSHAPMLAHWKGRFYLQYLSNLKEEHNPPARTLISSSADGMNWTTPAVVFPEYYLPEIKTEDGTVPEGMASVMHQRMGFYTADDGRLLTIGFYSYCLTPRHSPNLGQGLGRVVREVYGDGSFGPIYFIRYNRHAGWNESNTNYPFYTESSDQGFVHACKELLDDPLMTLQWWEMDRARDGFYKLDPGDKEIKALSYYHRPDGVVVGLWKYNYTALSQDEGASWSPVVESPSLKTCAAKVWGQKTDDGRYALVYNHSESRRNRFPLIVITGEDGHSFDNMLCVNGEVPPMRYQGIHKNIGTQYVRGMAEGNGDPQGGHMWVTYSMNKEDIWVSRIHVPVAGKVDRHPVQDFESVDNIMDLTFWNLYRPQWAPISLIQDPADPSNACLEIKDEEPWDYALAERQFPESSRVSVKFRVQQRQVGPGHLEVEVQDKNGRRPMRLRFEENWLGLDHGPLEIHPVPVETGRWYVIELLLDGRKQTYDCLLDGKKVREQVAFTEEVASLERIVFRTGPWRGDVRPYILDGEPGNPGLYQEDLAGAGKKVPASIFYLDDIKTSNF